MFSKKIITVAVLMAASTLVSAATLSSPIKSDLNLDKNTQYTIDFGTTIISGTKAAPVNVATNGYDLDLVVTPNDKSANEGSLYNVSVIGKGSEKLSITAHNVGFGTGTQKIKNLDTLTLITKGSTAKGISGYGYTTISNVKHIDITSEDDAIQYGGDSNATIDIVGFDSLNLVGQNGYGMQIASTSTGKYPADPNTRVTIVGNENSIIHIETHSSDLLHSSHAALKLQGDEADVTIKGGSVELEGNHRSGLYVTKGQLNLEAKNNIEISSTGNAAIKLSGGTSSIESSQITIKTDKATSAAMSLSGSSQVSLEGSKIDILGGKTSVSASKSYKGSFEIGSLDSKSPTELHLQGNFSVLGGTTNINNTNINLSTGNTFNVANLNGEGSTLMINGFADKGATVSITDNNATDFGIKAGGKLNDQYSDPEKLLNDLKSNISITNQNTKEEIELGAEAGSVSEGWYVDDKGELVPTGNPSMNAVANFSAMTLAQWRGEMNHLSMRLGGIRVNSADIGAWVRAYGYENQVDDLVSIKMKTNSIQTGVDVRLNNNWVVGGAFSYTDSEADFTNGEGNSDGYTLTAYATGYFDCGGYIDVIGRVGRLSSDVKADTLSVMGGVLTGDYDNTALGLSVETGYHWKVNDVFYIEPQAELAYGIVFGDDFTSATNGVRIEQDDFESLVGRLGTRFGATFNEGRGQLYAHASINHDFMGDADATATPSWGAAQRIGTELGATWVSFGVGAQFDLKNNLTFYGSLERSNGSDYDEDYRYSVGARYIF